jgi:lactate dehydrogenase-like 2-hydroxyacid dehydrogenase
MLSQMSRTGILVNIGRAQIVVKEDLIRFLRENPAFIYATDVWWNQQEMQRDIELLTIP